MDTQSKSRSPKSDTKAYPGRKVGQVLFNPAAENILASAAGDFTVKIWDIEAGSSKLSLKVGEVIQSLAWSADGSQLVTTSRDKKLRIWDPRQERPAHEGPGHAGAKASRAVWLGEHDRIATTGFSRMSDRQLALWDIRGAAQPLGGFQMLDSISGVCIPFWDEGTQCLFLAGKGDGNIRYYEYENDAFEDLSEYKSADAQRGVAFLPKRGVNLHENEVARAYKTVNDTYIEPISFIVPRRAESFQEDIYPPTTGLKPAVSGKEWFDGAAGIPPKISLEGLYDGTGVKEVAASQPSVKKAPEPVKAPEPKKETPKPAPEPTPSPTVRSPPPSMNEQGVGMAAAAGKFQDTEPTEESGDESPFEEVQKPVERKSAAVPASADVKQEKSIPSPIKASYPVEVAQPKPASPKVQYTSVGNNYMANQFQISEPTPTLEEDGDEKELPASSSGSQESAEREIKNLKALVAQQSRQLRELTKAVSELVSEVKALKST